VRLGKRSKDLGFGSFLELWVYHFQLLFLGLNHGFYTLNHLWFFFYWLIMIRKIRSWILEWWLTVWLGRVVSLLTLWRVVIIVPVLFMILGLGHILTWIRPNWHTWFVKVMIYRVDNIRVKRSRYEVWITICIEIIIIVIYIIKMSKTITKTNKQTDKKKERKNLI